jgi:hypothetical protein
MKPALSRLLGGSIVAVLAHVSLASAAALTCGEFPLAALKTITASCPSAGVFNNIRSFTSVTSENIFIWTYSIDMVQGPAASARPAAAALLITNTGTVAVKPDGTACPEAVDATVGDGAPLPKRCGIRSTSIPIKVRVTHAHI